MNIHENNTFIHMPSVSKSHELASIYFLNIIFFYNCRLAHDISPDYYASDDEDETDTVLQREKFLLGCLNQATTNINNNNSISSLSQTVCDKTENITETFAKLQWKEEQLEKINNEINKNHLTKEDHNNHINLINNNYIQVWYYDRQTGMQTDRLTDRQINNEINKNHLTKEDHNNHINLINNNYIQVWYYDRQTDRQINRQINNEIIVNKNHLTKEDYNNHINFINNYYIQVWYYDRQTGRQTD